MSLIPASVSKCLETSESTAQPMTNNYFLKKKRKTKNNNRYLGNFSCPFTIFLGRKYKDIVLYALLLASQAMPNLLLD